MKIIIEEAAKNILTHFAFSPLLRLNTKSVFVFFDAYGTLVELDDFYGRLQRGFATHGAHLSDACVRAAGEAEIGYYSRNILRAHDEAAWLSLCRECAQVMGDAAHNAGGVFDLPIEALMEILVGAIHLRLLPGTRETLDELAARGVAMGVLSNWDYRLPLLFEEIGLRRYFHFVLSSSQVGFEKPAPQIFEAGLRLARAAVPDLEPRDCFYVGDTYEKDVLGARAVGMNPILLTREAAPPDFDAPCIASLRELPALLGFNPPSV